jgi:alkylhydroperoxidase family enzyme
MQFADKVNVTPGAIIDADIEGLKSIGLSNKGVIQIIHLVSDFASYNRLNLALDTDYDYAPFGSL